MVTKKSPGLLSKMKDAVAGMFSSDPARKSPQRVEAGKKAATTAKVHEAATATKKAAKSAAKTVSAPVKTAARKASAPKKKSSGRKA